MTDGNTYPEVSIAANVAASVVWLTVDTEPVAALTSTMGDAFAGGFAGGLLTAFNSDFLFVTGAFDCTGTAFAVALDEGFTFDAVTTGLVPALAGVFAGVFDGTALAATFGAGAAGFAALPLTAGFAGAAFFATGFTGALDAADFAGAVRAFFAAGVGVFAGFFIAFAMESTAK